MAAIDFPPITAPAAMFKAHREKFLAKLPPDAVAILRSTPMRIMSNDTEYPYRPGSDFYYLTGYDDPDAIAVLRPNPADGKKYILFVQKHDARRESYEGKRAGPEGAVSRFGADAAFPIEDFSKNLLRFDFSARSMGGYLAGAAKIYLLDGGDAAWAQKFRDAIENFRARGAGPATTVDAREILHELRLVKDADEIALLKRAAEISARGHALAMKAAAPGKYEFEVQQALDGYCYANGARRMAYPSIVGSGPNSVFLHWDRNDRQMKDGEVVLNDSGAEYALYATDITRTYPVSGKFSAEQRALYEIVLALEGGDGDRRGSGTGEIEKVGAGPAEGCPAGSPLGDPESSRPGAPARGSRRFALVGLDVHDAGRYTPATRRALEPGWSSRSSRGSSPPTPPEGPEVVEHRRPSRHRARYEGRKTLRPVPLRRKSWTPEAASGEVRLSRAMRIETVSVAIPHEIGVCGRSPRPTDLGPGPRASDRDDLAADGPGEAPDQGPDFRADSRKA
jgi:Xaa-Pro aminopeptidase